jgi:large subunit ribosomal protein L32
MGVPKRKRSHQRRDKRFANKGLKMAAGTACQNCKEPVRMHAVCPNCGYYKGKKVLITKTERGMRREAERKAKAQREKGGTTDVQEPQA